MAPKLDSGAIVATGVRMPSSLRPADGRRSPSALMSIGGLADAANRTKLSTQPQPRRLARLPILRRFQRQRIGQDSKRLSLRRKLLQLLPNPLPKPLRPLARRTFAAALAIALRHGPSYAVVAARAAKRLAKKPSNYKVIAEKIPTAVLTAGLLYWGYSSAEKERALERKRIAEETERLNKLRDEAIENATRYS